MPTVSQSRSPVFSRRLAELQGTRPPARDRWVYISYDQLSDRIGALREVDPDELGIVLVESTHRPAQRPYHRQKLAFILANQRQFALEQAARGVSVRYVGTDGTYADALRRVTEDTGPLRCMRPAERELRVLLQPLVDDGLLSWTPHEGWLTTRDDFHEGAGESAPWRMDAFYRHVRRRTGILMEDGKPKGGRFSHDGDNREPWKGEPEPPTPPSFEADEVTREAAELVEGAFADHPGQVDLAALPTTRADAEALWTWAREECLQHFGTYEDAMTTASRGLFHTRISPLVNLHRLLPRRVLDDVLALELPLNSQEGFVRQLLGWREFVRHVHEATDGFRTVDPDAAPSVLGADRPLPPAYWGSESGLRCLDEVVEGVWQEGWSHHITRLMVLSNLATLLDVSPRELTDWFWVAYVDAFDWVVEPNVLAMGTYGAGDVMTTKPYISGAAYIDRMSDYCRGCAFHPKKTCPITRLYWAFLERHREQLEDNQRMRRAYWSLDKRPADRRAEDRRIFERVSEQLQRGQVVTPETLAATD